MSLLQLSKVESASTIQSFDSLDTSQDILSNSSSYFAELPAFHTSHFVEDSFLDLLGYIQRLAINAT